MGLAGFGWPVFEKVFHGSEKVQSAVGPDMVVEVLVFGQGESGVLGGEMAGVT